LSKLTASFVLAYHGCDKATGEKALRGETSLLRSTEPWHWLGTGIYFWEADPIRALEWAQLKKSRGLLADPFVVGAAVDLSNCLDLLLREHLELVADAYTSFAAAQRAAGAKMPENKKARGDPSDDNVLRYLDCAVIDHLCSRSEAVGAPFESVRGLFVEQERVFPGSGISRKAHSQIAVRDPGCIRGLFRVL
jgi:hypothetical protein